MKRQTTNWKKVFSNFISYKRLISQTYTTIQLSNKHKQNDWLKNGQKIWIDVFVKEDLQMTNKYMKRSLTSLVIREMQIKTQWCITSHLWECLLSKRQKMTNVGEDAEKGNPHALLVKSKLVQPLWKTM